jgi:hypothetical protein
MTVRVEIIGGGVALRGKTATVVKANVHFWVIKLETSGSEYRVPREWLKMIEVKA